MTEIAVVTGGNRGLGLEVCRQLSDRGFRVYVGARDVKKGSESVAGFDTQLVSVIELDVSDVESVARAAHAIRSQTPVIDLLVNNAGALYDTWEHASNARIETTVREALEVNTLGAWRTVQAFLPLLKKSHNPRIVNVSSEAGSLARMGDGPPAYQVSKAALNAFTKTLAAELSAFRVNAVCPGWVATDMGGTGGRSVQQGAKGIVWAATLSPDGPSGGFFRDGVPLPW